MSKQGSNEFLSFFFETFQLFILDRFDSSPLKSSFAFRPIKSPRFSFPLIWKIAQQFPSCHLNVQKIIEISKERYLRWSFMFSRLWLFPRDVFYEIKGIIKYGKFWNRKTGLKRINLSCDSIWEWKNEFIENKRRKKLDNKRYFIISSTQAFSGHKEIMRCRNRKSIRDQKRIFVVKVVSSFSIIGHRASHNR